MRLFTLILAGLLLLIQYPLWLGKGGWFRVWELDRQLTTQRATNEKLRARNSALEGEVRDLKQGQLAVEERARYELGMVRGDELFVQLGDRGPPPPGTSTVPVDPPPPPKVTNKPGAKPGAARPGAKPAAAPGAAASAPSTTVPRRAEDTKGGVGLAR